MLGDNDDELAGLERVEQVLVKQLGFLIRNWMSFLLNLLILLKQKMLLTLFSMNG